MTAYNGINGVYCSENPKYLDGLLRKEWKWDGIIMSDWYGTYTTTEAVKAGLDLEMPGPSRFRGDLLQFNASFGKPGPHIIDDRVRAVLNLVNRCAASGIPEFGPEVTRDTPETAALLRRIGNESIVLLKNDNSILPFKKNKTTLVLGPNAKVATYHGGGSAALPAYYAVAPYDGICQKLEMKPTFTVGAYAHRFLPLLGHQCVAPNGQPGMRWTVYNEAPGTTGDCPRKVVDQMFFSKTEMHLVDYSNPDVGEIWYADLEGSLLADEDCEYELGCVVSGTARVYVDGVLVIDNATKQVAGDAFYGAATREERGIIRLEKGNTYNIKVEFGSAPTFTLKSDAFVPGHGSLRVGGCKVIDGQEEIQKAVCLARDHDQVIICAGLNSDWETEGADRASMKLPGLLDQLIAEVTVANPNTAVIMQTGTPEEMPWLPTTSAVLQAWYGGNETGNCIADILFGDVNPSGKLSLTFPKRLQDTPSYLNLRTESGRILYGEDVYVGYRYYELAHRDVNFPFGHGLSYATFEFSNLQVSHPCQGGEVSATVLVKNTGHVAGSEVVQMYIRPRQSKINRPVKELRGFVKIHLQPGEAKEVAVQEAEKYAASYFDEERNQWCVEKGEYEVLISNTSDANSVTCVKGSFRVDKSYWWSGI
jgi:beta-glucosidase